MTRTTLFVYIGKHMICLYREQRQETVNAPRARKLFLNSITKNSLMIQQYQFTNISISL